MTVPTWSAVKAGASCNKIGAIKVSSGKKYTCVKQGKKLAWDKGQVIKKSAPQQSPTSTTSLSPSPAPSPSLTPTPTPSSSPTLKPSHPEEPKTFLDIKNYEQITYWAWKKSADKISNSSSFTNEVEIQIGPNSGILNKDPLAATKIASRLFAGFAQPTKLTFISYSFADVNWAQSLVEKLIDDQKLLEQIQSPNQGGKDNALTTCPSIDRCHSSQPFTNRAGKSIVIAGFTESRLTNESETKGQLQAHEFTHVVQQHQFIGSKRELEGLSSLKKHSPWWLVEGGAEFGAFASMNYLSYEKYLSARTQDVYGVPKQTINWFEQFINPPDNQYWLKFNSTGEIYNVGFMVTEIFTAVKGPDSQMQLFKLFADGKDMDAAFESVFGVPWKTTVPIIAKLISEERARG